MFNSIDRRRFLAGTVTATATASLGEFSFLNSLPAVSAAEVRGRKLASVQPDIEPLVQLIEDTDRNKLLEKVAGEIRKGTSYQDLLSAVFLAGVRGIQPRPVGFKFHAVLVINSAHLASLSATDRDRWLPLFWALDNFKSSQARNAREGNWHMAPPVESKLPPATKARQRFIECMDRWDVDGTDRAITAFARTASASEVYELLWRYGCRDFRDIGHKAIYVANSWRTLQTIGWRHAEPVLRSLAYALLEYRGDNPARSDYEADQPYRQNVKLLAKMGPLARANRKDPRASTDVLAVLRTGSAEDASKKVVELIRKGISPENVWDGLFLGAGELIMRQPGIIGIHCLTTANALYFAYQTTAEDETRRLLMLQCAAFLALFRKTMAGRGRLKKMRLDTLKGPKEAVDPAKVIPQILQTVHRDPDNAAEQTFALVSKKPDVLPTLMKEARRLIFTKGTNSHDYKFSSAVLEDYYNLTPNWRAQFVATSMYNLRGSTENDNDLIRRTRAALTGKD